MVLQRANQTKASGPEVAKEYRSKRRKAGSRAGARQPMHPGKADRLTHALSKIEGWNRRRALAGFGHGKVGATAVLQAGNKAKIMSSGID